jgi:hypothetical protein
MTIDDNFGADYASARTLFMDAAQACASKTFSYPHAQPGPQGAPLAIDIAWLGPADATGVVIAGSGTHGAEGLCGSGCQVGLLREDLKKTLPADVALVLVHANNPFGFAHLRRVNEDNVDLNRNFIDFDANIPANDGYAQLHDWLVPRAWVGELRQTAENALAAYIERVGPGAFQKTMSQGQYTHPDGLFYGGLGPSWSRQILERFAARYLAKAQRIGIVDFHTGLGPRGYGELIGRGSADDGRYQRARAWYGDEVRSAMVGDSSSVPLSGTIDYGYQRACPNADITAITLEFGTVPFADVTAAVRADNWLYARGGGLESNHFDDVKGLMREAFYGDDSTWRADIWARGQDIVHKALRGVRT